MSAKPKILFFARGYQAAFYPALRPEEGDDRFEPVFVTLTRQEADQVRAKGGTVAAWFEADFNRLEAVDPSKDYPLTSLMSERFLGRYSHEERVMILG